MSFFITARLASQDTREAFAAAMSEQLCVLLEVDLPVAVNEATWEATMLDLLTQAAVACQSNGGRLVLVVDGLDEDRGVTTGLDAHSIAALLPGHPPGGMRVIVSGRSNPPIPDDVPDWHPLRDPGIIRLLGDSAHARNRQRLGQAELKRLLSGSTLEQDLLGLITTARGGLSGPDLRELTGADLVSIENVLHTVAGRTFTSRPSIRAAEQGGPQVYLLGHEELHSAASYYLGPVRLSNYWDRIHVWAEDYRCPSDRGPAWPQDSPEYLLSGYTRMLTAAKDVDRLVCLTVDAARHDRMLDVLGGDSVALAEIKASQDLLLDSSEPDLVSLARLADRRDHLQARNANIPTNLPAAWVALGNPNRGEALARSITKPHEQSAALQSVAREMVIAGQYEDAERIALSITGAEQQVVALAGIVSLVANAGQLERARRLGTCATQIARSITDVRRQDSALNAVTRGLATAGLHGEAEQVARSMPSESDTEWALIAVSRGLANAGLYRQAEQVARSITGPEELVRGLAAVGEGMVSAGQHDRALGLAAEAEQIARSITDPAGLVGALAAVAKLMVSGGHYERALELAAVAESSADSITSHRYAILVEVIAEAMAASGQYESAERIVSSIRGEGSRIQALASVARIVADSGAYEHAQQMARTIPDPKHQELVRAAIARSIARAGRYELAEEMARAIDNLQQQARLLATIAHSMARTGQQQHARRLAIESEQIARSIPKKRRSILPLTRMAQRIYDVDRHKESFGDPGEQPHALAIAAESMTVIGQHEKAERIVRLIDEKPWQLLVLAEMALSLANLGQFERARTLALEVEGAANTSTEPYQQTCLLVGVARAAAQMGEYEQARRLAEEAEQIALCITNLSGQALALAEVASLMARVGEDEHAERIANSLAGLRERTRALTAVTYTLASAGQCEVAERIARSITDREALVRALTAVARAMVKSGQQDHARRVTRDAEEIAYFKTDVLQQGWLLPSIAQIWAEIGEHSHAEQIVRFIDPKHHARALARVACTLAKMGEIGQAERIAETIADSGERVTALRAVISAMVAAGRHDNAYRLAVDAENGARSITEPAGRVRTQIAVVRAMLAAGYQERGHMLAKDAEKIAHSITDPDRQVTALLALADIASKLDARRLLGKALALGPFLSVFPQLAKLYPEEALRIADEIYAC